ncbi:glycoside hydrolase family 2 protein [Hypoxylon sp. FL1284]|nr:glycoside hydrolase family 2 protein [Hypoxylon sp. FL1284]
MTRPRRSSGASEESTGTAGDQELGSMYDYLAKVILLGPSGTGKSCLLHRFVKNEWRVLSSQTIGVEFASKIIKVGTGARRKRIKLQLWDTAGTERFRSVSRSYYRGAAGAILCYDLTSHNSFRTLQPFLNDARALASPNLTMVLVGNKVDLANDTLVDTSLPPPTPSSTTSSLPYSTSVGTVGTSAGATLGTQMRATVAPEGREVSTTEASRWASSVNVPVTMEVSAFSGEGVDEIFGRLARMILTKIELGEIDPDDPMSGIQYGDGGMWNAGASDGGSIKSSMTADEIGLGGMRRRRNRGKSRGQNWGMREWEEVAASSLPLSPQPQPRQHQMEPRTVIPIDKNWEFKQADKEDAKYLPVGQFPTNVHLDLLAHKLIPDPYIGKNELDVQWVGEAVWVYRTTFASPAVGSSAKAVLAFDGLDTFATVVLNGTTILETENMFIPERVDVTAHLEKDGGENELVITFDSAYLRGWKLVEKYPDHKWGCWNGDNSRLAGWDWGPTLLTCGPWRPIHLEVYESRISDLWFDVDVDKSLKAATITSHAPTEGSASIEGSTSKVRFDISLNGTPITGQVVDAGLSASIAIAEPELWYPIRYGKQPLYTVTATLEEDGKVIDSVSRKIGIRKVELIQRPLKGEPGTSLFFQVNGISIFCGGSDWIPADNFIPRISKERYYDWVKLAADGNQYMIRVWGGGIYEEQAFYDACDELGVMVWQDFMFGCGNYPAWPELRDSIKREAEENVKLLRHHPSIVIYAGNNEDYQYAESVNLTWEQENKDAESWLKTDFPARYIYEKILADVCQELTPSVYYHPGSPWGGVDTRDPTVGDIHQWNVWHGTQEKYQNFDKLIGRFVSEFGMEAFPSIKTIDGFLPLGKADPERYAQSSTLDFHNKADGHERRIALYLVENMRYAPDPLEQFVYATQLMQAECLSSAYRLWRRQWKGPGREYCGGALVWQLDDCWPVASWAVCDYHLRPKHAYYTVRREMAPLTVAAARRVHRRPRDPYTRVRVDVATRLEVWASSLAVSDSEELDCVVAAWDVETGRSATLTTVASHTLNADPLVLKGNRSTEIAELDISELLLEGDANDGEKDKIPASRAVVAAYLVQRTDGARLARYVNWPEPLKYAHLPQPQRLRARLSADRGTVLVDAEVPVKGVALECDDDDVRYGIST